MLFGGIAQLARACGSYPQCHWFKSSYRYHVRNHICIPSKCDFFLPTNRVTTRFAGIFRLSDEKPEASFFCQKLRKNRKILRIITNAKKRGGADSNPSNPHKH